MSAETDRAKYSRFHDKNMSNPYYVLAFNERQHPETREANRLHLKAQSLQASSQAESVHPSHPSEINPVSSAIKTVQSHG